MFEILFQQIDQASKPDEPAPGASHFENLAEVALLDLTHPNAVKNSVAVRLGVPLFGAEIDIKNIQLSGKRASIVHFADGFMQDFAGISLSAAERNWARLVTLSQLETSAKQLEAAEIQAGIENKHREFTRWASKEEERLQREQQRQQYEYEMLEEEKQRLRDFAEREGSRSRSPDPSRGRSTSRTNSLFVPLERNSYNKLRARRDSFTSSSLHAGGSSVFKKVRQVASSEVLNSAPEINLINEVHAPFQKMNEQGRQYPARATPEERIRNNLGIMNDQILQVVGLFKNGIESIMATRQRNLYNHQAEQMSFTEYGYARRALRDMHAAARGIMVFVCKRAGQDEVWQRKTHERCVNLLQEAAAACAECLESDPLVKPVKVGKVFRKFAKQYFNSACALLSAGPINRDAVIPEVGFDKSLLDFTKIEAGKEAAARFAHKLFTRVDMNFQELGRKGLLPWRGGLDPTEDLDLTEQIQLEADDFEQWKIRKQDGYQRRVQEGGASPLSLNNRCENAKNLKSAESFGTFKLCHPSSSDTFHNRRSVFLLGQLQRQFEENPMNTRFDGPMQRASTVVDAGTRTSMVSTHRSAQSEDSELLQQMKLDPSNRCTSQVDLHVRITDFETIISNAIKSTCYQFIQRVDAFSKCISNFSTIVLFPGCGKRSNRRTLFTTAISSGLSQSRQGASRARSPYQKAIQSRQRYFAEHRFTSPKSRRQTSGQVKSCKSSFLVSQTKIRSH